MIAINDLPSASPQRIFVDLKPTEASNVTSFPRGIRPVDIADRSIVIDKTGGIIGMFASYNCEVELTVRNISDPQGVLLYSSDRLLAISIGDNEPQPVALGDTLKAQLSAQATPLHIRVMPGAINDCEEQNAIGKEFPIQVDLELRRGKETATHTITIPFSFLHDLRKPHVEINCVDYAPYTRSDEPKNIGQIFIKNLGNTLFEPAIDCICAFEATYSNPKTGKEEILPADALYADFEGALGAMVERMSGNKVKITGLQTKHHPDQGPSLVEAPIYIDFSKLPLNPIDTPQSRINCTIKTSVTAYNPTQPSRQLTVSDSSRLSIVPNDEEIELRVKLYDKFDDSVSIPIDNGSRVSGIPTVKFQPGSTFHKIFHISLSNTATKPSAPKAGLCIRNIEMQVQKPGNCKIEYTEGESDFITLHGDNAEIFLPSAPKNSHELDLDLWFAKIRDMYLQRSNGQRIYDITFTVKLKFEYYADQKGDHSIFGIFEDNAKTFECAIQLPTHVRPPKEWLAIDFGTSAIVSEYGGELLDLHGVKRKLFSDASTDTYEKDTPFLSSNLILRQTSDACGLSQLATDTPNVEEFSKLAMCLSPTSDTERANIRTSLPYLKLIVGYDLLPNIQNYANFTYQAKDPATGAVEKMTIQEPAGHGMSAAAVSPLAKVDRIFEEVYRQLFRYYITDALEEANRVNQIVLTIPNTYTPQHILRIEKIVRGAFVHTYLRSVRFVSESDAVACFYQSHWPQINTPLKRQDSKALKAKENVLVFDMGAGTLDLTLFTRTEENDLTRVKVFGKMGIAKAGNYLDCLLAKILSKKAPSLAVLTDPVQIGTDADRLIRAFALKEYVKNTIKPALSSPGKITLKRNLDWGVRQDVVLDVAKDILADPDFKAYIRACTVDLIGNFFRFYGKKIMGASSNSYKVAKPIRRVTKPFKMWIEEVFSDPGRLVVAGIVESGEIKVGDEVTVNCLSGDKKATVTGIKIKNFTGDAEKAKAEDAVVLVLNGLTNKDVRSGLVVSKKGMEETTHKINPTLRIDTVLLSGRSTKLKPLRTALQVALAEYASPDMKIVEIGSVTEKDDKFDKAKTVVTEGALDYVTKYARENDDAFESDTITACYGIIYRDTNGDERYLELLNPYEIAPTNITKYNGMTVKEYTSPEKVVNLRYSDSFTLVQTYLVTGIDPFNPSQEISATETEWKKGNREYITVVSEFSTSDFTNPQETHISVRVNEKNQLILHVNGYVSEPSNTTKIDINSESNIMSLWPMMSASAKP